MLTENHDFNEIYERYKNLVLKVAYLYSNNYEVAEDITQETFLRLYKNTVRKETDKCKGLVMYCGKTSGIELFEEGSKRTSGSGRGR